MPDTAPYFTIAVTILASILAGVISYKLALREIRQVKLDLDARFDEQLTKMSMDADTFKEQIKEDGLIVEPKGD